MSSSTETFTPDSLLAGDQQPILGEAETLAMGQNLTRGTALGKLLHANGGAVADGSNTGEGGIGSTDLGHKAKIGDYLITCVDIGTPAIFSVVDPDGNRLADAVAEVPYAGPIAFTITAYGVAFALGDLFTFTVSASSGYVTALDSDNVDGSEDIYGILAEDCDASLGATVCSVYTKGEFNTNAVDFAAGDAYTDFEDEARKIGIVFRTNLVVP